MDELLELMEEKSPGEDEKPECDFGMMDELADLMEKETENAFSSHQQRIPSFSTTPVNRKSQIHESMSHGLPQSSGVTPSPAVQHSTKTTNAPKPVEASVDDRLGIRMLNRLVSSADTLNLITNHPYFSPASLCAMSLAKLNTLLLDPARIVDSATVAGKTNIVTVGIVFSNTGTRLSSKGGAFCVLNIGNLASGPCLTVFLFGDAYGKYCRSCSPGKVVALLGPKLLASSGKDCTSMNNNDNPVSFSVYDCGQLQILANSRDFGVCQGKIRIKQSNGTWSTDGQCKHYVDNRISQFCSKHKQQHTTNNGPRTMNKKMQKLNFQTYGAAPVIIQSSISNTNKNAAISNRFLNPMATRNEVSIAQSRMSHTSTASVPQHFKTRAATTFMLAKDQINNGVLALKVRRYVPTNTCTKYLDTTGEPKRQRDSYSDGNIRKRQRLSLADGDWLMQASKGVKQAEVTRAGGKSLAAYMKTKCNNAGDREKNLSGRVNTDSAAFDGSVLVPPPTRIFQDATAFSTRKCRSSGAVNQTAAAKQEILLQRQAEVARVRKEVSSTSTTGSASELFWSGSSKRKEREKKAGSRDKTFFDAMGDFDREKVRNAKSRFSNLIEGEEYAVSRQKILEWEKLEEQNKSKTHKSKEDARLTKEWRCKTCSHTFSFQPKNCKNAGHKVIMIRGIRRETTKAESRTELHSKGSECGGLQLGAGLEWSCRFAGNRFLR